MVNRVPSYRMPALLIRLMDAPMYGVVSVMLASHVSWFRGGKKQCALRGFCAQKWCQRSFAQARAKASGTRRW
jgi:hypothetical protein